MKLMIEINGIQLLRKIISTVIHILTMGETDEKNNRNISSYDYKKQILEL